MFLLTVTLIAGLNEAAAQFRYSRNYAAANEINHNFDMIALPSATTSILAAIYNAL